MPTDSRSLCPSLTHAVRASVLIVAGALAGCGRPDASNAGGAGASAVGSAAPAAQAQPAPQRVIVDTTPVTPPPPALAGQPNVSEVIVLIEPVAYDSIAPAEVLLTDAAGRRAGVEPVTWRALLEIPNTRYDSTPPLTQTDGDPEPGGLVKQLNLVTPRAGHYALQILGRRNGTYTLTLTLVTPRDDKRQAKARAQQIREGEIHLFRFAYDDAKGPLALRRQ